MKAVGIICSPRRNGNSEVLVREILKSSGCKDIEFFYPNEMDIKGCQACYSCKEQGKCVVNDDMQTIYKEIEKADIVVFGAPIYMSGLNGQFKIVLDRLFAFLGLHRSLKALAQGQKAALVVLRIRKRKGIRNSHKSDEGCSSLYRVRRC